MSAERIANTLYELGFRVADDLVIDDYRLVVVSGNTGRVCDVLIYHSDGTSISGNLVADAFCKPSPWDNWTRYSRVLYGQPKDCVVHVEGPCFMVGKYFMERAAVESMVSDTEENRQLLIKSLFSVENAVKKVVTENLSKKPELADDCLVKTVMRLEPLAVDATMPLSDLKRLWLVRRDFIILDNYTTDPLLAKSVGRALEFSLFKDLLEDRALDLMGTMVAFNRANFMLTNPGLLCFMLSVPRCEEISDCDNFYAIKIAVNKELKAAQGLLGFMAAEQSLGPKIDLLRQVLEPCPDTGKCCPKRRLGLINEVAVKYAVMGLKQEPIALTPGMLKLREIGYESWWNENVGALETYAEALDRVCAARGESRDELLYKGINVVSASQELFQPAATFNDPKDYEAVFKVLGNHISSTDIVHALMRL